MTDLDGQQELGLMAKLALGLTVALIGIGVLWYGTSAETLERVWRGLLARPSAHMSFRFILQPGMAAVLGVLDGLKDARTGRSPFIRTIARDRRRRIAYLREALSATARIILLGLAMDLVYQLIAFEAFYPAEAAITVTLLAFLPYVLIRGPVARLARRWYRGAQGQIR